MAITRFEQQIMNWVFEIMNHGFYQKNERTGVATKRLSHAIITVDCKNEVPLIKAKKTQFKTSIKEMFWIFRDGSNNIHDLDAHIWDDWADENGIVNKTYGYQIREYDQVNRILNDLAKDPSTRRAVIDLWNNADLPEMSITPCVYTSIWDIVDGKLNAMVVSRSCDFLVGGLFNIFQYYVMVNLFARHLGVEPGIMTFSVADIHIYENQFEECKKMMSQYQTLLAVGQLVMLERETGEFEPLKEGQKEPTPITENFIHTTADCIKIIDDSIIKWNEDIATLETKIADETITDDEKRLLDSYRFDVVKWQGPLDVLKEIVEKNPEFNVVDVYNSIPSCTFNEEKTNFFEAVLDDITVNYQSMPFIKMEVAV